MLIHSCKHHTSTHQCAYTKRHDESMLPPNVDLLNVVKDDWKQHESKNMQIDFSKNDDALQDDEPWINLHSDYYYTCY